MARLGRVIHVVIFADDENGCRDIDSDGGTGMPVGPGDSTVVCQCCVSAYV